VKRHDRWLLGLTGGIASGKSTVAAIFAGLGVPTIDLDQVGRDVVAPGTRLLEGLFAQFGQSLRQKDGQLDRRALRQIVFADADKRMRLELLLHPAIRSRCEDMLESAGGPYAIVVNPLLAESGDKHRYDRVLVVDCDPALQRQRLASRDGAMDAEITAILAAQATRAQRLAIADDVLLNDGNLQALTAQVRALHQRYLGLAGASSTIAL
jgi:dephospho-CoA kinase